MAAQLLTLCIVHQGEKVLLGMKKRGFGAHLWNGFGGKVAASESIEQAAIREMQEEAFIIPDSLHKLGILHFGFQAEPDMELEVHVFKCRSYEGKAGESEEMRPRWFSVSEIPFEQMWKDDRYWFGLFLQDKKFRGRFVFDADHQIIAHELREVTALE